MIDLDKTKDISSQFRNHLKENPNRQNIIIEIDRKNLQKLIDTLDYLVSKNA